MQQFFLHITSWLIALVLAAPMLGGAALPNRIPISNAAAAESESAAGDAVLYVLFFWSTGCPDCRQMMDQDFPSLSEKYGRQLKVLYVDVDSHAGDLLFQETAQMFALSRPELPVIVVQDTVLDGRPELGRLEDTFESYLEQGGAAWPAVPGLENWLAASPDLQPAEAGEVECTECELQATRAAAVQWPTDTPDAAQAAANDTPLAQPLVRAVMFWMEGCGHCHFVIENVLPPIQAKYGDQLEIYLIELTGDKEVAALYELAERMGIAKENVGVPFLVIGEHALVGSDQIPAELPGLIDEYLADGGVDYPEPSILGPLLPVPPSGASTTGPQTGSEGAENEAADPQPGQARSVPMSNGFTEAMLVMAGMAGALVYSGATFMRSYQRRPRTHKSRRGDHQRPVAGWVRWAVAALILIGLIVAGYLAYVETQAVTAVCGPIGDCNAVQSSDYARLFGVLPIGVLGIIGFLAIGAAWLIAEWRQDRWGPVAMLAAFGMAFGGVVFSLYLTYLEPFVIKAVCAWCLTSAVVMTLILLFSLKPALNALAAIRKRAR